MCYVIASGDWNEALWISNGECSQQLILNYPLIILKGILKIMVSEKALLKAISGMFADILNFAGRIDHRHKIYCDFKKPCMI